MFTDSDLKRLIFPLIIEQILSVLMGMADIVMVASCSEAAVSGVSLIDGINILLLQLFAALATGGAVIVSQYLGKDQRDEANNSAKQLVVITLILATAISGICIFYNMQIINMIFGNIDTAVFSKASTYFLVTAISYPFIALFNAGAALFRSMGNSKLSMKCSVLMNVLNIIGNAILIYGFNLEVLGAAIATTTSRIIGAIVIMYVLRNEANRVYVNRFRDFRFDFSLIKKILFIGIPSGLENVTFHLGKLLTASLIASFGTSAITANAVANNIANMACIPEMAIGLAMIAVIGQCMGANEKEMAKNYSNKLLKKMWIYMIVLNTLIILFTPALLSIYSLSFETHNLAKQLIYIYCFFAMFFIPLAFGLPNALRAAGDVKFTMISSMATMWICRVGLSYVFALYFNLGLVGVWLAMCVDWAVRGLLTLWRFKSNKWLEKRLI